MSTDEAYSPAVPPAPPTAPTYPESAVGATIHRRRPTTGRAHAERVAWGAKWGAVASEAGKRAQEVRNQ